MRMHIACNISCSPTANQSRGRMHSKIRFCINILNGSLCRARFKVRRSKIATNTVSAVTPAPDTQRLLPNEQLVFQHFQRRNKHICRNSTCAWLRSKYATHLLLIKYSRCSAEQLLQLSHANVHWLVFLHSK